MLKTLAALTIAAGVTIGGVGYASTQTPPRPTVTSTTVATMPTNPPRAGDLRGVVSSGFYTAEQQRIDAAAAARRAVKPQQLAPPVTVQQAPAPTPKECQ